MRTLSTPPGMLCRFDEVDHRRIVILGKEDKKAH